MTSPLNDALCAALTTFQQQQAVASPDARVMAEAVDTYVHAALYQLRQAVTSCGPTGAAQFGMALAQSAVADHGRRDFTRRLPSEVILKILEQLDWDDVSNAGECNRKLNACATRVLSKAPMSVVHLANMPHVVSRVCLDNGGEANERNYGSALLSPVRCGAIYSQAQPHGVELFERQAAQFVSRGVHRVSRRIEQDPKWMRTCSHAWHPDGTHFAVVHGTPSAVEVQIVDRQNLNAATLTLPLALTENDAQLAWSPGAPNLLAVSSIAHTRVFDLEDANNPVLVCAAPAPVPPDAHYYTPPPSARPRPQWPMVWSPTGAQLFIADAAGSLALWDLGNKAHPQRIAIPAVRVDDMTIVVWHPCKQIFLVATQEAVSVMQPGVSAPLFHTPTKTLLAKFPGQGGNCTWVTGTSTTDRIHAAWQPEGHDFLAISRGNNLLLLRWEDNVLTALRHEIAGLGGGPQMFLWREADTIESRDSGGQASVTFVCAAQRHPGPRPKSWRDGALGTSKAMRQ